MTVRQAEAEVVNLESEDKPFELRFNSVPVIRICVVSHENTLDFQIHGEFAVRGNTNVLLENNGSNQRWRIKLQNITLAEFNYSLLHREFTSEKEAQEFLLKSNGRGEKLWLFQKGAAIYSKDTLIHNGSRYCVVEGQWESEEETILNMKCNAQERVLRQVRKKTMPAKGLLELFNMEYDKTVETNDVLHIIPSNPETIITLFNQKGNKNNNGCRDEIRCRGPLTIKVDDNGHIVAIMELSIDDYIKWIQPVPPHCEMPPEFLKTFAIAKRGELLYKLGEQSTDELYDIVWNSEDDLIQVLGCNDEFSSHVSVESTKGKVLTHKKKLCNSLSSPICGGRTENGSYLNGTEGSYLTGNFDIAKAQVRGFTKNLNNTTTIHKWIEGRPEVYCNYQINDSVPSFKLLTKYFRWEVIYTRSRLESVISQKLRKDIGIIYDLIPISRSTSGHIERLEILGSVRNIILSGEKQIRFFLDENLLPSTCFEIISDVGDDGVPVEFTLRGAGWGHGIGMCQAGALSMALQGMNHKDIINHYYKNTEITKIY